MCFTRGVQVIHYTLNLLAKAFLCLLEVVRAVTASNIALGLSLKACSTLRMSRSSKVHMLGTATVLGQLC